MGMIEFCVLGSGSAGNAALVRCGGEVLLIDAGLSARELRVRMEAVGVEPGGLSGILLTHEHGDHVKGLANFTKAHGVPVLATAMTRAVLGELVDGGKWRTIPCGGKFEFAGMGVETFAVPHDAVEPVGYVFSAGGVRLGVVSDLGHATRLVETRLAGVDALFLEANYDPDLLAKDTKRPWSTRQRIAGRHGHLSNQQAAELVVAAGVGRLQRVVLGHLSRDCNHPELAAAAVAGVVGGEGGVPVSCASQGEPTPWYVVRAVEVREEVVVGEENGEEAMGVPEAWLRGELF